MTAFLFVFGSVIFVSAKNAESGDFASLQTSHPRTIDHTCVNIDTIPEEHIQSAMDTVIIHYAHTSHGSQIITGLSRIETTDSNFSQVVGYGTLPDEDTALCILDGNPPESYITPDLYWESQTGLDLTQNTLDDNPTLTVSLWSWCTQLNYYSLEQTQDYIEAMASLETDNPDITFIYMTCNAQSDGENGFNRYTNNQLIREYCQTNNKWLFDFADLDAWSNGIQNTYEYVDGTTTHTIPLEHPDFNGNEAGHTTYSSCEQKGRAFWWLVSSLAGWNAPSSLTTTEDTTPGTSIPIPDIATLGIALGIIGVIVILSIAWARRT
jgi:hypothetical protein